MIALVSALVALVTRFPEILPLMRTLITTIGSGGSKEEKISRAKRAILAASGRQALFEALPGSK